MRFKNNDLVPQIFMMVAGVILVGLILYYIMNAIKSSTNLADVVISNSQETATYYAEYDISKYNGEEVRGQEVVNFIKKQLGDYLPTEAAPIYVEVVSKTLDSTYSRIYTNNEHLEDIKNFSKAQHYIKPTAVFLGRVIRNENKVIIGVRFTQK